MRLEDWADKMWRAIDAHKSVAFDWETDNCCHFAFRVADAMTGRDTAADVDGLSCGDGSAAAHLEQVGGLIPAVSVFWGDAQYGRPTRGDIAAVETPHGLAAGIWVGDCAVVMSAIGLTRYPRSAVTAFWSV